MKEIQVSIEVFAKIWSLRADGENSEDAVLSRILLRDGSADIACSSEEKPLPGLIDNRFGVEFPEGFSIHRNYLGTIYSAVVNSGQWRVEGVSGRFSTLNELSKAIGTKTENAWKNWFFVNENGERQAVAELRDPGTVKTRTSQRGGDNQLRKSSRPIERTPRWCDDVRSALVRLGGSAHLSDIYREVRKIREAGQRSTPPTLEEVIRKELEVRSSDSEAFDGDRGEDWFSMPSGKGAGFWSLRNS